METGKITERVSNISEASASREFPQLRREKKTISLFGSQDECFVLEDGKLSVVNLRRNTLTLLAEGVQGVAGGEKCYAFIKSGRVRFFENGSRSHVFDGVSDITRIVSDGKQKFYLRDSSGRNFSFDAKAARTRRVLDKEIAAFEDYTYLISTVSSKEIQELKSNNWAEYWVKSTDYYKNAVSEHGAQNVGIKIYDSDKKVLDDSAEYKVIVSVSFSVFTVRNEAASPVVPTQDAVYFPEAGRQVYIEDFMYTDTNSEFFMTEFFFADFFEHSTEKAVCFSTEAYPALGRFFVNAINRKRMIKKGLILRDDGTLRVYDSSSEKWKDPSFPIKNVCDIALFGKEDNVLAAVSKTNGEIIVTQYATLLDYSGRTSSINIIRTS